MRFSRGLLLLGTAALLHAGWWAHGQPSQAADTIAVDATIQAEIARTAAAQSEADLQESLTRLRASGGEDFGTLIPQLVVYLMNAPDVHQAMAVGVIIERLQISPPQLERALEPYRSSSDARVRQQIGNLLGKPETPSSGGP
jgi:hypothetical protein